ncbi:stalk domain-containing protein [Paenibacillus rubinfantis]|uniref:stalk domain-containing protein n=1 Tax=Paenibacillus rubinfantis TaxID=1720296 RepID=UPI00073E6617|nr:stalk domain-containing protein [Paenibacillus rubinfantis]
MKKKIMMLLLTACLGLGTAGVHAAESAGSTDQGSGSRSLKEAFNELAIIPSNYQGKAFMQGQKTDIGGDYEVVQRNGRVLVPIRLMGYLAEHTTGADQGYWDVVWNAKTPDDVLLQNLPLKRTVKFTVNSTTMLVNGKSVKLDVPPQKIGGRVMLPLRDAATALGKQIAWLDGLILIGDTSVDLKHPDTLAVKNAIKTQLTDQRNRVDYEKVATPLTQLGTDVYYLKTVYLNNGASVEEQLFRQTGSNKATRVQVPGKPVFHSGKRIGDIFYYVSTVSNQAYLFAYDLKKQQPEKVASLGDWRPEDGWLTEVRKLDNELLVNLHVGDLTMGGDMLYRVKNGALEEVLSAKSLTSVTADQEALYSTDFRFMTEMANNLSRLDLTTGETALLGEPGYAYGVARSVEENGGVGFRSDSTLVLKDGALYAIGFNDSDPQDPNSVYRIDTTGRKHVKLVSGASQFWLTGKQLYYLEESSGRLMRTALNGGETPAAMSSQRISQLQMYENVFYYTSVGDKGMELFRLDPTTGQEKKLAALTPGATADTTFEVNKSGVYYVNRGYEPGIYHISSDGKERRLSKDTVDQSVLTDSGMIYTLVYKEGVYSVK